MALKTTTYTTSKTAQETACKAILEPGNTKGGSIAVLLASCLTGLD
jgi:hypothetical protein